MGVEQLVPGQRTSRCPHLEPIPERMKIHMDDSVCQIVEGAQRWPVGGNEYAHSPTLRNDRLRDIKRNALPAADLCIEQTEQNPHIEPVRLFPHESQVAQPIALVSDCHDRVDERGALERDRVDGVANISSNLSYAVVSVPRGRSNGLEASAVKVRLAVS